MSSNSPKPRETPPEEPALPPSLIAQAEAAAASSADDAKQFNLAPASLSPETSETPGVEATTTGSQGAMQSAMQDTPIENAPPPAYSGTYGQVDISQDGFDTQARVASDGRVNIRIHQQSRRLSDLLVPALRSQLDLHIAADRPESPAAYIPPGLGGSASQEHPPPMNVVIHVVGSRGDVQPFVALGQVLKRTYGHRVRLATHPTFRTLVEENGLEFFSISGDPAELMAFMVKNPGLMPGMDSLRSGDIGKRRKGMYDIVKGCWRSCFETGDGTGIEVSDDRMDNRTSFDSGFSVGGDTATRPFVADVIIANPPSFAHIHCAEKLGIPLHLMFTMPWSPTQAFPHPLANIQSSNADTSMTNFVSYALVELMTWQGLGDVINRFREKSLGLEPVSLMWAPGMASRLRIPYTYCWSPALIPKPKDWGPHISISGFYFLSLAGNYTPSPELAAFLQTGSPPVYIGFGSIVVEDPNAMTKLIFDAVKKTGQRALVSKGWGGLGADALGVPDGVFMLGNVPHDWLFKHVSCVVHHGGAGTTAAGIALGKPTVIVPFFGDQTFWGAMVAKAGAGPPPIPHKHLTSDSLASAINKALKPTALQRAQELGAMISSEKGTKVGAQSFHKSLGVDALRCALVPSRAAVWRVKRTDIRLSAFAASTLANEGSLDFSDLRLYRPKEYDSEDGPWDPISGGASALLGTMGSMMMGFADFPVEILKALRVKHPERGELGGNLQGTEHVDATHDGNPAGKAKDRSGSVKDGDRPLESAASSGVDDHNASTPSARYGSLARALSVHTRSPSHNRRASSDMDSQKSKTPVRETSPPGSHISLEAALGAGKGVGRIVGAGLKSPMDFTLGLARGFHNAPKIYGDESVRTPEKITGFQSGLKAAGKEFGFGFYDGISGLVTQPLEGAKKEGVAGLIKGFGKGIGGVVLKPGAAMFGLPGYTFQGIYKELQKHLGSSVQNYIIAARTAQGYEEWRLSTHEERLEVVRQWHTAQVRIGKQPKKFGRSGSQLALGFNKTKHMTFDERKQYAEEKKIKKKGESRDLSPGQANAEAGKAGSHNIHAQIASKGQLNEDQSENYERAIRESVKATSRGDPDEDMLIERAIRASVAELQLGTEESDEDDAVRRAVRASVVEAGRVRDERGEASAAGVMDKSDNNDSPLKQAPKGDTRERYPPDEENSALGHSERNDSGVGTDDDDVLKVILEQSRHASTAADAGEADVQKAIELSRSSLRESEEAELRAKAEEEIVLEYVKKQSLAEERYRQSQKAKGS
ncbi:glycosyltransferase family 1 protein [Lasallia pustulata]|uniref:Glycosyltransferase family 1 protein n=1 Tax=Lasallia pustulata TaxID=136370 RepID=A0A1W5D482_9LECA|nr:glycosyltransferase family 1 protein [Lasallia pustulata]